MTLRHGDAQAPGHDDVVVHYGVGGSGPVMLAHPGGPGTSAEYLGDLARLDEAATIVWLDPRGTGGSSQPADPMAYGLDDYVADVEALRAALGLERMILLGFSHGGMVAQRYAAQHADRLDGLILLGTAALRDEATIERVSAAVERRAGEPWYAEVRPLLDADELPGETDEEAGRSMLAMMPMYFHRWDAVAQGFVGSLAGSRYHRRTFASWNLEAPAIDLRPELARITAPTLVVVGEDDFVCDVTSARLMADAIRGSRLAIIPEAGHFPWVEQPAAFRAAVDPFLAECSGSTARQLP